MQGFETHPVQRLLHRLADCIWRHPQWFFYPHLILFAIALLYAGAFLEFKTDTNDLVSSDVAYQRHWRELKDEFHVQEDLVTLVESEDREKNRQFVERLAARLEAETNLFTDIFFKGDLRSVGPKALLLLPEEQLEQTFTVLRDYQPLLRQFSNVTNLDSLFANVESRLRGAAPEGAPGAGEESLARALPALTRIIQRGTDALQRTGVPPSPGLSTLFRGDGDAAAGDYLQFSGGRLYVVTCAAQGEPQQEVAIRRLRELVDATLAEVPGVNAGVTGEPVLRLDEMKQAKTDTSRASLISLVVVVLIFIFCYHETRRPLKANICLVVGVGYTLGFATLVVGHLNILTITFVPILIGLAIDFGVHLISRFEEELREGHGERVALDKALVASGTGILTSGLTVAAAFLAMAFTAFKGIREMGVISGGGIILCLVPMLTMLPAMLLRGASATGRRAPSARRAWHCRRERIEQVWLRRPWWVLWAGMGLTVFAVAMTGRLKFDYNPLNLQSQKLSAVIFERRLLASSSRSILTCAVTAGSLDEALALEKRIRRLPSVADVDSVASILAGDQEQKLLWVRRIVEVARSIHLAPMDRAPADVVVLDQTLKTFGRVVVGAIQYLGAEGDPVLKEQLYALREASGQLRAALATGTPEQSSATLTHYQQALFGDMAGTLSALQQQEFGEPLHLRNLPPGLRSRFIGKTGKFLLQVYPRGNVWEHEAQEQFVRELRTIDPAVTGSPVRFYETTRQLKNSFQMAAAYALVAILLVLLIHFRNVASAVLALLPVVFGIFWTLGLMVLFGVPFNSANIISPTLLIGIGAANGIHILNRFTEEKHPSILGRSTGKAVLVSALTTCTGFGSLILAQHAGIASLGLIMAAGSALCMVASLTILPALLTCLARSGWRLAHGWITH